MDKPRAVSLGKSDAASPAGTTVKIISSDNLRMGADCLDEAFSTVMSAVHARNDKVPPESLLPSHPGRKGEGGLGTKGNRKQSYQDLPLVTVITVVMNGARYLEETIRSVINLEYDNVEYIIIDGGSDDGSVEIIKQFDREIDYWVSEPDKGIYDAMNKGWELASENTSILFLGAGDKIIQLPEKIYNDRIIYGNVRSGEKQYATLVDWRLKFGNTLHHQALLVPKQFSLTPPFNLNYPIFADFDFSQKLLKQGRIFQFSKSFLSFALPGGVSAKLDPLQLAKVVNNNYGVLFACISYSYHVYQKLKHGL